MNISKIFLVLTLCSIVIVTGIVLMTPIQTPREPQHISVYASTDIAPQISSPDNTTDLGGEK